MSARSGADVAPLKRARGELQEAVGPRRPCSQLHGAPRVSPCMRPLPRAPARKRGAVPCGDAQCCRLLRARCRGRGERWWGAARGAEPSPQTVGEPGMSSAPFRAAGSPQPRGCSNPCHGWKCCGWESYRSLSRLLQGLVQSPLTRPERGRETVFAGGQSRAERGKPQALGGTSDYCMFFEKDLKPPPEPLSLLTPQINALMFNLVLGPAFS